MILREILTGLVDQKEPAHIIHGEFMGIIFEHPFF